MRELLRYLLPYRGKLGGAAVLVLGSTVVESAVPYLLGRLVDTVLAVGGKPSALYGLAFAYLAAVTIRCGLSTVLAYMVQGVGQGVMHELRGAVFGRILHYPVPVFDDNPVGRLLSRVINDIKSLSELFTASMSVLAVDCFLVVGTVAAMLWLDWRLAMWVLLTLPLVWLSVRYFGRRLAAAYRRSRTRLAEINAFLGENIDALATIQRLAAEEERMGRFTEVVESHREAQIQTVGLYAVAMPVTNVLYGISMGILLWVGSRAVVDGRITVGVIVAFAAYLKNLFNPVEDLIQKYNLYLSAKVSAERIGAILEVPGEPELETVPERLLLPREHAIEFDRVSFRYPSKAENALTEVSFRVPHGTSLAVVGATGSGKSTLIRLLMRFYEPDDGDIRFGGHSLRDWNRFQLRRQFGLIPQEMYLLDGTLRENLTLGRGGFSDGYLEDQCRRAELWDLARDRGGLDFRIREGGTNLSLGERQLIAFARVFVFNPPVLILDEATASLDRVLERKLMAVIRECLEGRTSLIVAHRLSTIQRCHQVIVMERGRLAEAGTIGELQRGSGIFARMQRLHGYSSVPV